MRFTNWIKSLRKSLTGKLIGAFIITSSIPALALIAYSYINTSNIVRDNVAELTQVNLQQTKNSLNVWVDSYEDILFQIYMNDDIVNLVERLNEEEDNSQIVTQLRRRIHGMFYTKDYIKCISIISESGDLVFYDLLTGKSTRTSWLSNVGYTQDELYEMFSQDNRTHIISTREAGFYASQNQYLFHLGHRIIDYQNVKKQLGVVIISVDEQLLEEIGNDSESNNSFNFMVDNQGRLISYFDKAKLGQQVIKWSDDEAKRKEAYLAFVQENGDSLSDHVTVDLVYNEDFGCDIVNVSNQNEVLRRLDAQQRILVIVVLIAVLLLCIIIITLTKTMTHSIKNLVGKMKKVGSGDISVRVDPEENAPSEIKTIGDQFNNMLDKLQTSLQKENEATKRQKDAEISALEAQINPHFLYNTLDTINWMAIDKDELEISNSITSLAKILRYGIDNSNGIVKVHDEYTWIKQYLFLQQTRLKDSFTYDVYVEPAIMDWNIHKLLIQPFIENSIIHGFQDREGEHQLEISIEAKETKLVITVKDNGKGIDPESVELINRGMFEKSTEKNHIGMENALTRIKMYYHEQAQFHVDSKVGEYTCVTILLPRMNEKGECICEL